jgi:hypothetical protein
MTIPREMKENIFLATEGQMSLKDFESWLYANDTLSNQMNESVVLEVYAFNYNQKDAQARFSSALLPYFDRDEFLLWKITLNLKEIIEGRDSVDRILSEFARLADEELPFLYDLAYYRFFLDEEWFNRDAMIAKLKRNANELLVEIAAESKDPQFKVSSFVRESTSEPAWATNDVEIVKGASSQKKWWEFWR